MAEIRLLEMAENRLLRPLILADRKAVEWGMAVYDPGTIQHYDGGTTGGR